MIDLVLSTCHIVEMAGKITTNIAMNNHIDKDSKASVDNSIKEVVNIDLI